MNAGLSISRHIAPRGRSAGGPPALPAAPAEPDARRAACRSAASSRHLDSGSANTITASDTAIMVAWAYSGARSPKASAM